MQAELVKSAIKIKMVCKNESPLISPAEYLYSCALALKRLDAGEQQWQAVRDSKTIEALRAELTPFFENKQEQFREDPPGHRLLQLLVKCRMEGEISDEVRKLMDEI